MTATIPDALCTDDPFPSLLAPDRQPSPVADAALPEPATPALRVGLVGFGRTGRDVAAVLLGDSTARLEWVVRRSRAGAPGRAADALGVAADDEGLIVSVQSLGADDLLERSPVDSIIDFSSEDGLSYYGEAAARRGIPIVTAISHYSENRQRDLRRHGRTTAVLWSPNITLGVNFILIASQVLRRMSPHADIQVVEEHFAGKQGRSGTALKLAAALDLPEAAVHSVRAGGIIGVHEVVFGYPNQTVRLRHEAISREAFGHGALFAASRLATRDPGNYRMEDLLLPYFAGDSSLMDAEPAADRGVRARVAGRLRVLAGWLD